MIWPVLDSKAKEPFYVHRPCFFLNTTLCKIIVILMITQENGVESYLFPKYVFILLL